MEYEVWGYRRNNNYFETVYTLELLSLLFLKSLLTTKLFEAAHIPSANTMEC